MTILTHYVIALLTTSFTLFILGIFVCLKGLKRKVNWIFGVFVFSAALWSLGEGFLVIAPSLKIAIFWNRVCNIGIFFIATCFVHFVLTFLDIKGRRQKIIFIAYVFSFTALILNFTEFFLPDPVPKFSLNYFIEPGPIIYPTFVIIWFGLVIYGIFELFRVYISSSGIVHNQLKYLFWGTLIGYTGGSFNYLLTFDIEIQPLNPFGTYSVPIFFIFIAYAIVRYRLMDINVVIGRAVTYSIVLAVIIGTYLGLMLGFDRLFFGKPGYNPALVHLGLFILLMIPVIFILPNVTGKAESVIMYALFKNKYDYIERLRQFGHNISFILKENELIEQVIWNVAEAMQTEEVLVVLSDDISGDYVVKGQTGFKEDEIKRLVIPQDNLIIRWLYKNRKTLIKDELEKILSTEDTREITKDLTLMQSCICIPLTITDRLLGMLSLGERAGRRMYSDIDITTLESLVNQLALAISYKKLEAKISRSDKLVSLGTLAAGMAHEIRNPLSTIQTFAQLLPQKYNDPQFRDEFSQIVASDTQRIARIIESIMALASPKLADFSSHHISTIIDEALVLIETEVKKNCVKVIRQVDHLPQIKGDKEELKQVFLNLFLNAIQAMKDKTDRWINIQARTIKDYVRIEVSDNGVGIDPKIQSRIFDPFFTTKYGGTGLGLSISHRIIEEHKGKIAISSELGKGATFYVDLPVAEEVSDARV